MFSLIGYAQNKGETVHSASGITKIDVDGTQIFNISIETKDTDKIKITSLTDGEYQDDFQVFSELKNKTLKIGLRRTSFDNTPDDKRNAHKVIAATLKIEMPMHLNLSISSDIGSVIAIGDFNELTIQLSQGSCRAEGLANYAVINTIDGAIDVKTKGAVIETDSKRGLVSIPNSMDMFGINIWKLTTIGGNISVVKDQ